MRKAGYQKERRQLPPPQRVPPWLGEHREPRRLSRGWDCRRGQHCGVGGGQREAAPLDHRHGHEAHWGRVGMPPMGP